MNTDRKALVAAVRTALKAVGSRPGIPALTGILVEVGSGEAILTATDLEISIRVPVEAATDAGESWRALIPARILADVLKASKSPEAELFVVEKEHRVYIDGTALRVLPVEDYPEITESPQSVRCAVFSGDLVPAIACVEPAATRDFARPVLTGVLVESSKEGLGLTATDSYRLHHADVPGSGAAAKAVVPARALKTVAQMLGRKSDGEVVVLIGETLIRFMLGDGRMLMSRLIEGEFPNWQQLVPPDIGDNPDAGRLEYERANLEGAIARAAAITRDGNPIRLDLNGVPTISASAPDLGQMSEVLDLTTWNGPELAVSFNPHYLVGAIVATGGAPLYIRDGLKPVVALGRRCFALVMPVRLPSPVDVGIQRKETA